MSRFWNYRTIVNLMNFMINTTPALLVNNSLVLSGNVKFSPLEIFRGKHRIEQTNDTMNKWTNEDTNQHTVGIPIDKKVVINYQ